MNRNVKVWAQRYLDANLSVVPLLKGQKRPVIDGWSQKTFDLSQVEEDGNVGLALLNIVDVDPDHPITRAIAAERLPMAVCRFGHGGEITHYLYRASLKPEKFAGVDKKSLIEIRSGAGQQTMVPPSVHPGGDVLTWALGNSFDLPEIGPELLRQVVRNIAASALIALHWPVHSRHEARLAVGGFLFRAGVPLEDAVALAEDACRHGGSDRDGIRNASRAIRDSYSKLESDPHAEITGGRRLEDLLVNGAQVVKRLRQWFGRQCDPRIERLNQQYCRVLVGGTNARNFVIDEHETARVQLYTWPEFKKLLNKEPPVVTNNSKGEQTSIPLAQYWLAHPDGRMEGHIEVAPYPLVASRGAYNLWREGFAVQPDRYASWKLLRQHLFNVLSSKDEGHFLWQLNWLRCLVQLPGELPGSAIVWRGHRGAGKGMVGRAVRDLFLPRHAMQILGRRQLTGHFNAHQAGKVFLYGDEGVWGTSGEEDRATLQGLITEPIIPIEAKGVDVETVRNVCHLLMSTNDRWAAPAGAFERRFFMPKVDPKYAVSSAKEKKAYFDPIYAEIRGGGLAGMLYSLLHEDKADLDLARTPPRTSGLWQQLVHGFPAPERFWFELLTTGNLPGQPAWSDDGVVDRNALTTAYMEALSRVGDKKNLWKQELAYLLRRVLPAGYPREGPRHRGQGRTWVLPPLKVARRTFLDKHGFGHLSLDEIFGDQPEQETLLRDDLAA